MYINILYIYIYIVYISHAIEFEPNALLYMYIYIYIRSQRTLVHIYTYMCTNDLCDNGRIDHICGLLGTLPPVPR